MTEILDGEEYGQQEIIDGTVQGGAVMTHDNTQHSATYITSAGVTYDNLNANSDVGTGSTQVAAGDHGHALSDYIKHDFGTGTGNIVGGTNAGAGIGSGDNDNVILGHDAVNAGTSVGGSVVIGDSAAEDSTTVARSVILGQDAALDIVSSQDNVILGYQAALADGKSASILRNIMIGRSVAQLAGTNTNDNTLIGYYSGYYINGGQYNVCVGSNTGYNLSDGVRNVFVGYGAGNDVTTGDDNIMIGENAGDLANSSHGIYIGSDNIGKNCDGSNNILLGQDAGEQLTGDGHIGIGISAAKNSDTNYTGSNSVCIGNYAGDGITGGDKNVLLGYQAGKDGTFSNVLIIENSNDIATPLIYGEFDNNIVHIYGKFSADEIDVDPTPGSDHDTSGIIATQTAGETVNFGDLCYLKAADSEYYLVDADAAATMPGVALAMATITDGNTGKFLKRGYARDDTWNWTVGGLIYASTTGTTGNTLTQTAPSGSGDQVQVVGYAESADVIWFDPNLMLLEIT